MELCDLVLEDRIDVTAANGVCWDTRSALAAALSHFIELGTELALLGSRRNTDLTDDDVDALWTQACPASDSLTSYVPLSIAYNPPDGVGMEQGWSSAHIYVSREPR
jgi:hypothetical protein